MKWALTRIIIKTDEAGKQAMIEQGRTLSLRTTRESVKAEPFTEGELRAIQERDAVLTDY